MFERKKSENVKWHNGQIVKDQRREMLGYSNKVLWLTGLPSSGKSTLARELEKRLHEKGFLCYVLDGDNIRHGLNGDLGFSQEDRRENIRRITEVANLFYDAGVFVIVAFISPYKKIRKRAKELIGDDFVEIFVDCSLEECEKRDPKSHYKKAREGLIKDFTGVSAPYERPENPAVIINTEELSPTQCVDTIISYLDFSKNRK